jgi:putative ABC transport system permease protein
MARRVALARKNLFQDRRRALLAITGVGAALMLVLLLEGVLAGAMQQVTAYPRASPAEVFVSQAGVRTMHMSESALAPEVAEAVSAVEGVAWVEALHYTTAAVAARGDQRLSYVFGYDTTTGRAGPSRLAAGRPPRSGEAVLDEIAAGELGVGEGDTVEVLGVPFRVSGLSVDGTNIVTTTVFIPDADFAAVRGPSPAFVLVGAASGIGAGELADRVAATVPGVTVQTRAEFVAQEQRIVSDMAADVMAIMSAVGFLISLAVVALTLYTATLAKVREYGVVRALGAGASRLAVTVIAQAGWTITLGLVTAVALSAAGGALIGALTPNVAVSIEAGSVLQAGITALIVGALASVAPLRRVLRVDPATAFRSS